MVGGFLGNYRILSVLGEGGFGVVYLGAHAMLGNRAAIKVLNEETSRNAEIVQRFFNEAKAATVIRHPGIVQIFDFGVGPTGNAFFVMELLDGESLTARLRREGTLAVGAIANVARQLCGALAAAHGHGIVHRDLKPDNVFLVPDPDVAGGERTKILDFGIAKLAGDALHQSSRTKTGSIIGTPMYMSPEQCRGAGNVDARSDIYSLGCMLYEMACGRPPFVGEGAGEILGQHQFVAPPSPRSLNPSVPKALEAVILKSLAKEPAGRQQSMNELSSALEPFMGAAGRARKPSLPTIPAAHPSSPSTLSQSAGESIVQPRSSRRWIFALVGGLAVTGGVIAVVAGSSSPSHREMPTSQPAIVVSSSAPAAPTDPHLAAAEKALTDGNWDEARGQASEALAIDSGDSRAKEIRDAAHAEQSNELVFEAVGKAVARKDIAEAARQAALVPPASWYRPKAIAAVDELRAPWFAARRSDATDLAAKGRCDAIGKIAADVAAAFPEPDDAIPDPAGAIAAIQHGCGKALASPPSAPVASSLPAPAPAPAIDVAAKLVEAKQAFAGGDNQVAARDAAQILKADPSNAQAMSIGALAACRMSSHDLAVHFAAGLTGAKLNAVKQVCAENGIQL